MKVIKNQQELYQLDKNVNEKPTADQLAKENYITAEQLKAYNNSKSPKE